MKQILLSDDLAAEHDAALAKVRAWLDTIMTEKGRGSTSPARVTTLSAAAHLLAQVYSAPHRYARPVPMEGVLVEVAGKHGVLAARKAARLLAGMGAVVLREAKAGPAKSKLWIENPPPAPL